VEVTASAQPTVPVTLELPVLPQAVADVPSTYDGVVLVLHQSGQGPWEPLGGRLDRRRSVVTVSTPRLSRFEVRLPSLSELRREVGELINGALGSVRFNTSPPMCSGEEEIRSAGYSVTSSTTSVLRWCVGEDRGGLPELRVVANRSYPLVVTLSPGMSITNSTGGQLPVVFAHALAQAASAGRQHTLSPGGTTVLAVRLPEGGQASLRTEFDGLAHALVSLTVATDLLLTIAGRLPGVKLKARNVQQALAALDAAECVPKALDLASDPTDAGRVGAMVSACLDREALVSGRLAARVLTTVLAPLGGVIAYAWGAVAALVDEARGASRYRILVSRRPPGPVFVPATVASAQALERLLTRAGLAPGAEDITEIDCTEVGLAAAAFARGDAEVFLYVLGSDETRSCPGDPAVVHHSIRGGTVAATTYACGECEGDLAAAWAAIERRFTGRPVAVFGLGVGDGPALLPRGQRPFR
jgi:hypothetical protein